MKIEFCKKSLESTCCKNIVSNSYSLLYIPVYQISEASCLTHKTGKRSRKHELNSPFTFIMTVFISKYGVIPCFALEAQSPPLCSYRALTLQGPILEPLLNPGGQT